MNTNTIIDQEFSNGHKLLSPEQLSELDERTELHESGKAVYYTMEEMTRRVFQDKRV